MLNLNRTNKIFGTTKPFFRHQIIERKKKYKKIYRATKQYANHTKQPNKWRHANVKTNKRFHTLISRVMLAKEYVNIYRNGMVTAICET